MAKKKSGNLLAKVGIGLAAATVAGAAATYFIYEKSSPKTKKKIKGWTLKAKGEVLERLEDLKEINEKVYNEVIDEVGKQYKAAKKIDAKDVDKLTLELKKHWKSIQKEYGTKAKKVRRLAERKKIVKKKTTKKKK